MPNRIRKAKQRLAVCKTMLEMHRLWCRAYFNTDRFGGALDELVLCVATFIGHAEGKPMTATKLADFAGVARPTAIRKLESLSKRGIIRRMNGANYMMVPDFVNSDTAVACADAVKTHILKLAMELSKMDNQGIADQFFVVIQDCVA